MSAMLELLLIVLDSLGRTLEPLEPLIERIAASLNFDDAASRGAPIAAAWPTNDQRRRHKHAADFASRLGAEMRALDEAHAALWLAGRRHRLALLAQTGAELERKWPWLSWRATGADPLVGVLNCTSHDICLLADWDFVGLAPVGPLAEGRGESACKARLQIMRSDSLGRKIVLQLAGSAAGECGPARGASEALKRQAADYPAGRQESIVTLHWASGDEYAELEARSALAFYYVQTRPQLTSLYLVVSDLLERAQLLEAKTQLADSHSPLAHLCAQLATDSRPQIAAQCATWGPSRRLDRYALLLMLVAHLDSSNASAPIGNKAAHNERRDWQLAHELMRFLATFGALSRSKTTTTTMPLDARPPTITATTPGGSDECVCVAPSESAQGKLNLSVRLARAGRRLLVLDPLARQDSRRPLIVAHNIDSLWDHSANLTKRLEVTDQIGRVFARAAQQLDRMEGEHDADSNVSVVRTLFTRARCNEPHHSDTAPPRRNTVRAAPIQLSPPAPAVGHAGPDVRANVRRTSGATLNPSGAHSEGQRRRARQPATSGAPTCGSPLAARRAQVARRKLLTNLLWLALFLLARNLALTYLEQCQRDLKANARDDLVQLKRALFSGAPQAEAEARAQAPAADEAGSLARHLQHQQIGPADSPHQAPSQPAPPPERAGSGGGALDALEDQLGTGSARPAHGAAADERAQDNMMQLLNGLMGALLAKSLTANGLRGPNGDLGQRAAGLWPAAGSGDVDVGGDVDGGADGDELGELLALAATFSGVDSGDTDSAGARGCAAASCGAQPSQQHPRRQRQQRPL